MKKDMSRAFYARSTRILEKDSIDKIMFCFAYFRIAEDDIRSRTIGDRLTIGRNTDLRRLTSLGIRIREEALL